MKKKYKLPVSWEMCGIVEVEADSLEEAVAYFENNSDHIAFPSGEYVDASFGLNMDSVEDISDCYNDGNM